MELKKSGWRLAALAAVAWIGLAVPGLTGAGAAADAELLVFAAASTTNALTQIGELYAARNQVRINPSFAASSTLAKQIESGAPADIFLSADKEWMDYVEKKNMLAGQSRFDLLSNRLVLIVPADSPVKQIAIAPGFSLKELLGPDGRIAMGDPDHVPVGRYGRGALQQLGSWDQVKERLAPMKDVRAVLTLVERAEAPVGLVYSTDAAISSKVRVVGAFPTESHPPIVYPVAALSAGKTAAAGQFLEFLKSAEARTIFETYGFIVR